MKADEADDRGDVAVIRTRRAPAARKLDDEEDDEEGRAANELHIDRGRQAQPARAGAAQDAERDAERRCRRDDQRRRLQRHGEALQQDRAGYWQSWRKASARLGEAAGAPAQQDEGRLRDRRHDDE